MHDRLQQLKDELQKGQQEMVRLDRQRQELRDTMLRIAGAIQVLEELSAQQAQQSVLAPQAELAAVTV
jgi:prefoldin subunit 5